MVSQPHEMDLRSKLNTKIAQPDVPLIFGRSPVIGSGVELAGDREVLVLKQLLDVRTDALGGRGRCVTFDHVPLFVDEELGEVPLD